MNAQQHTPGEAVKAFREFLRVHPVGGLLSGHEKDDMALELARIALDFSPPAPIEIKVVAYLPARHHPDCAQLDPTPGHCDCGARPVPLVRLVDAQAAIKAAQQKGGAA